MDRLKIELHDPRPDDLGELAALVAKELRKRGIAARVSEMEPMVVMVAHAIKHVSVGFSLGWWWHGMFAPDFACMGPIAIANEIQALEAKRAQEWAGDK